MRAGWEASFDLHRIVGGVCTKYINLCWWGAWNARGGDSSAWQDLEPEAWAGKIKYAFTKPIDDSQ